MAGFKKIVGTVYQYTHVFVGAGAIVTSFLATQQMPPKWAAGVVLVSQGLKVAADWLGKAKAVSPLVEKIAEVAVAQAEAVVHPTPAPVPSTPLEPAVPVGVAPAPQA